MLKCACQFKSLVFLRAHVVKGIIIGSANTKRSGLRGKNSLGSTGGSLCHVVIQFQFVLC